MAMHHHHHNSNNTLNKIANSYNHQAQNRQLCSSSSKIKQLCSFNIRTRILEAAQNNLILQSHQLLMVVSNQTSHNHLI